MPEEIVSHVKAFYSKYNKLDRNITKNIRLNIEREIETLPLEQKTLLYARLYLNGNVKYKKYYQTAEESELSSEMYILDKILFTLNYIPNAKDTSLKHILKFLHKKYNINLLSII